MKLLNPNDIFIISQKIALLDAILSPEWEYRYYSFNNKWSQEQQMASMRDGSGIEYFILFENENCGIKYFNKTIDNTCKEFYLKNNKSNNKFVRDFLNEPAFSIESTTYFAFWDELSTGWTEIGRIDGKEFLIFTDPIEEYIKYAEECFERKIRKNVVSKLFSDHLSKDDVLLLNNEINLVNLQNDLEEIGLRLEK